MATLLAGTAVALATAVPAYADPGCQNGGVYILWARGSGQAIGDVEATRFQQNVQNSLNAAGIGTHAWAELGNLDGNNHVDPATEYPAAPALGVFDGSYNSSVFTGVNELIASLNHRYTLGPVGMGCNTETAVLGGYSQGADVIGWALALTDGGSLFGYPIPALTPAARSHIGFVAQYGDPHFNVACGQDRPWVRANARCDSVPRLGVRSPYLPSDFINRAGSWCDDGDGICAVNFWTIGIGTHITAYRDMWIQQSAAEIVSKAGMKVCSFVSCQSSAPPSVPWNFENLDGDPGSIGHNDGDIGRQPTSIVLNGVPHVFYHDASHGRLVHAWDDPTTGWHFEVLDGAGGSNGRIAANLGGNPTVILYNGGLQLFYYDFRDGSLRHGISPDGYSWSFENFDGATSALPGHSTANVGQTSSAIATPDGLLQVFYNDASNGNLRHAWWSNNAWHFENLDGDPGSIARFDANLGVDPTTVVYGGVLQLFYRDISNGNLRHAWNDPTTGWHFENLDGDVGSIAGMDADTGNTPAAIVYNNTLQLFYGDSTHGTLRHAWEDATGWHFEDLEGSSGSVSHYVSNLGLMPAVTVLNGTLQVFYYEAQGGNLRHAIDDPVMGWRFENLDGAGGAPAGRYDANVGYDPTAVAYNGHVQLFYYDSTNGNLRHAWSQ